MSVLIRLVDQCLSPIKLSLQKLKDILDESKPMDTDVFNMVVRILALRVLRGDKNSKKPSAIHYMDLEFSVCSLN